VIEADRRPPLQHGLRLNLTAKPYLAGHNENARRSVRRCNRGDVSRCIASVALARSAVLTKSRHRCHVGLSSVAEKQQAWDVREGELNFD
jgi:hypothetical protein